MKDRNRTAGRMLLLAIPAALLASCADKPVDLPYGTPQQFMAEHVQPAADVYWGAVRFESVLEGDQVIERDIRPETDEEWQKVAQAAAALRQYGEALASPAYAEGRGEDWLDFAQGLQDVATQAEEAAKAKDPDAVFTVGGTVYNVCSACHQAYPPEELPPGVTVDDVAEQ